jgi:hypothetical protein
VKTLGQRLLSHGSTSYRCIAAKEADDALEAMHGGAVCTRRIQLLTHSFIAPSFNP